MSTNFTIVKQKIVDELRRLDQDGSMWNGSWEPDIVAIEKCDDIDCITNVMVEQIGYHKDEAQQFIDDVTKC